MPPVEQLAAGSVSPAQRVGGRGFWLFSWPLLAGLAVHLMFFLQGWKLLQDGDTYWHIATGRWILQHRSIPSEDPFSHTMAGAAWTAQEWLSDVILALVHQAGGWTALVALTTLAFAAAIALLTRALLRWLEPVYAVLFAGLAVLMTAGHLLARPHMLALPLIMLWTIELVHASEERRAPAWWMLPLMTLWANMHGGFTLGIALALVFAAEALLGAWHERRLVTAARSWALFLALTVGCAMLTPHGPQGLQFTWQVLVEDSYALERIGEWRSPNFHYFQPLELWLLGGLALVMHQGLRLPPIRLVLLLGLLHLALKHVRSVELVGLLGPLIVAAPFAAQWRLARQNRQQLQVADRLFQHLARPAGPGAVLIALILMAAVPLRIERSRPLAPPDMATAANALRAVKQAGIEGPVLNSYKSGGYLIYSGIPVFIDGRSDMYRTAFMKEYVDATELRSTDSLPKVLEKYQITWTLLDPDSSAIALLDRLPGWRRVYSDQTAVVHARMPESGINPPPQTPSP
jgi:hypothetical protein